MPKKESLLFKFDMLPPNAGDYARMHWAVKKQIRDAWEYHVAAMARDMGLFPNEDNVLVYRAKVVWRLFVRRRRDKDNAYQMLKIPLDAMRRQFILFNDSPAWIDVELEQQNSPNEWCEIEIYPKEGDHDKRPKRKRGAPQPTDDSAAMPVWT